MQLVIGVLLWITYNRRTAAVSTVSSDCWYQCTPESAQHSAWYEVYDIPGYVGLVHYVQTLGAGFVTHTQPAFAMKYFETSTSYHFHVGHELPCTPCDTLDIPFTQLTCTAVMEAHVRLFFFVPLYNNTAEFKSPPFQLLLPLWCCTYTSCCPKFEV